jgi:hypothetical protein
MLCDRYDLFWGIILTLGGNIIWRPIMVEDKTKRKSHERRAEERRQRELPIKMERRGQLDRRTGVDRRLRRKD